MTREELFTDCMPLVERAVRCCHVQEPGQDDARQAAYEALWLATDRCDPERAPFFRAYAKQVVFGAVKNWLERERGTQLEESDSVTARPSDDRCESSSADVEGDLCDALDGRRALAKLRTLPAEQREAASATILRGVEVCEYARRAGLSRGKVRRRLTSALVLLKKSRPSRMTRNDPSVAIQT